MLREGGAGSAVFSFVLDLLDHVVHLLVKSCDDFLLLRHAVVRVHNALLKDVVLVVGEVTGLGVLLFLFFIIQGVLFVFFLAYTEERVPFLFLLEHLLEKGCEVLRLESFLDLGPHLNDGVLQFHFCRVANQRLFVVFWTLGIVVENVVECNLIFWFEELLLDVFLSNLKIGSRPDHVP